MRLTGISASVLALKSVVLIRINKSVRQHVEQIDSKEPSTSQNKSLWTVWTDSHNYSECSHACGTLVIAQLLGHTLLSLSR